MDNEIKRLQRVIATNLKAAELQERAAFYAGKSTPPLTSYETWKQDEIARGIQRSLDAGREP